MAKTGGLIYVLLFFGASGCGFGHAIERPNGAVLVENLGDNRYVYRSTRLAQAPARGAASPALGTAPPGARDVGLIEVTVTYSGMGGDGLRNSESEFYSMLGKLAGELGGTHFVVLRSMRETRPVLGQWITSLTAQVVAVETPAKIAGDK